MKNLSSQHAFILPASLMLVLFLSILSSAAFMRTQSQFSESEQRLASQQAFFAAESGLQRAVAELRLNSLWDPGVGGQPAVKDVPILANDTGKTFLGSYSVVRGPAPNYSVFQTVRIKSTGTDANGRVQTSVLARVVVENPANFFISTTGDLHVSSGAIFNSNLLGRDIYFDINRSLPMAQQSININGDVFYLRGHTGDTDPSVHITGQIAQSPNLSFTGVDLPYYKAIALNGSLVTSDIKYSGPIDAAHLGAPNCLVYATGDIYLSGDVLESMIFIAEGNIYIEGDIKVVSNNGIDPQIGLLARKDVIISASAPDYISIEAFVVADGGPGSKGGVFLAQGSKFSKTKLTFKGAIAVRADSNAPYFVRTGVDLNAYQTRIYNPNPELQNNRIIPFMPFIANIVRWKEDPPQNPIPGATDIQLP